jgi:hypothetical protein
LLNLPGLNWLPPSLSDLTEEYPELASILKDQELDSVYKEFLVVYQRDGPEAALILARKRGLLNANDELRMTLELDTTDTAALQTSLESHGIIVTAVSGNLMDISIPLDILEAALETGNPGSLFQDIADLEHIIRIRLPQTNLKDQSSVETESLPRIGATAWQLAGYTGQGVKVGVLDVGFDGYRKLLGSELPANVTATSFISGMEIDKPGEVHGGCGGDHPLYRPGCRTFFRLIRYDCRNPAGCRLAVIARGAGDLSLCRLGIWHQRWQQ